MLWKPITPVYPRLIQRAPEGLTLEQATEMRKKGRNLMPIRQLAKNGVYADLVKNVREAFEECELVRINCQGIKGSDFRKIGAKLKDLVPCVLISFEDEHILMWRGNNWKSSFLKPALNTGINKNVANEVSITGQLEEQKLAPAYVETAGTGSPLISSQDSSIKKRESVENELANVAPNAKPYTTEAIETTLDGIDYASDEFDSSESMTYGLEPILGNSGRANEEPSAMPMESDVRPKSPESSLSHSESSVAGLLNHDKLEIVAQALLDINGPAKTTAPCTERVLHLMKQAVENGSAVVLDDATLDAEEIYKRSVAFAQSAPPGPVFRRHPRKVAIQENEEEEPKNLEVKEVTAVPYKRGNEKQASKTRKFKDIDEHHSDVVPKGSLRVDELAKLLA